MKINFKPEGVCTQEMNFEIEDGIVKSVEFVRGCHGNGQGVGALAVGRKVEDVIAAIKGITCKDRPTSCPDQMAIALEKYLQQ